MRKQVVDFGGEGETPGAINVNNLVFPVKPVDKVRKDIEATGGMLIEEDFTQTSIPSESVDQVIGKRIPSGAGLDKVAREAYRILKPGGAVRFSTVGMPDVWVDPLTRAGFKDVHVKGGFTFGTK